MNEILFQTHQKHEVLPKICKANEQTVCNKRRQGYSRKLNKLFMSFINMKKFIKYLILQPFLKGKEMKDMSWNEMSVQKVLEQIHKTNSN